MAKTRNYRFSRTEKSWILYDWANSAYSTIITAAVFPIYFTSVAAQSGNKGDVWWGYATSAATLVMAFLAPFLGALADFKGMKKKLFGTFLLLGLAFTTLMALTDNWKMMLVGYAVSYIGFAGSCLFYDSFLTDVTTAGRMDRLSAWGFSMGYLGGSTIPFLISIGLILFGARVGIDSVLAVKISVLLCVFWWAIFSLPILRNVHQVHYVDKPAGTLVAGSIKNIRRTALDIIGNKAIFIFMLAYFFYIDGVNTVIHMATAYGSSLGLGSTGMILALLVTQLVAVPFSIGFSRLSSRVGAIRMISLAIVVYFFICLVGFYMGFSLEPSQKAYTEGFRSTISQTSDTADLDLLDSGERESFSRIVGRLFNVGEGVLAGDERVVSFDNLLETVRADAEAAFSDPGQRAQVQAALSQIGAQTRLYLLDEPLYAEYGDALKRATMLFWAMAVLVGTCQGGIQALSRSFFGKLIPPERSNEFYGFFDIFGKFAAVIGPGLYAVTANLTGRSSFGILSLLVLFAAGLITIVAGKKHLSRAEAQAALAAGQKQETREL